MTVVEPPSPVVAANTVTLGFSCSSEQTSGDKESVTPDTDREVRNIMAGASPGSCERVQVPFSSSSQQHSPHHMQATHPQQASPQAQPQQQQGRSRKISWVQMGISSMTSNLADDKASSSLERLLGLFQNPVSLFNKTPSQPPPASQTPPKRSPQSSPQQQRASQPQVVENGMVISEKCSTGSPITSEIVSNERRPVGNGSSSSCSLRPLAVIGQNGDSNSVKRGRDVWNNNEHSDVNLQTEKCIPSVELVSVPQKDENLNVQFLSEASGGSGDIAGK